MCYMYCLYMCPYIMGIYKKNHIFPRTLVGQSVVFGL
jgi:hypothetical protein